jgi:hypothetical protein
LLPVEEVMKIDEYAVHGGSKLGGFGHGAEGSKTNDPVRVPPSSNVTSVKV